MLNYYLVNPWILKENNPPGITLEVTIPSPPARAPYTTYMYATFYSRETHKHFCEPQSENNVDMETYITRIPSKRYQTLENLVAAKCGVTKLLITPRTLAVFTPHS